jgi:hypothetical protein
MNRSGGGARRGIQTDAVPCQLPGSHGISILSGHPENGDVAKRARIEFLVATVHPFGYLVGIPPSRITAPGYRLR